MDQYKYYDPELLERILKLKEKVEARYRKIEKKHRKKHGD